MEANRRLSLSTSMPQLCPDHENPKSPRTTSWPIPRASIVRATIRTCWRSPWTSPKTPIRDTVDNIPPPAVSVITAHPAGSTRSGRRSGRRASDQPSAQQSCSQPRAPRWLRSAQIQSLSMTRFFTLRGSSSFPARFHCLLVSALEAVRQDYRHLGGDKGRRKRCRVPEDAGIGATRQRAAV